MPPADAARTRSPAPGGCRARRCCTCSKVSTPSATISIRISRARLTRVSMIVAEYLSVSRASTNILSILMKSTPSLSMYDRPLWTGADIVDPDARAEPLQRRDDAPCDIEIVERLALGDLEQDLARRNR